MKHEHRRTGLLAAKFAPALLGVALFTACGADAPTSSTGTSADAVLAYEALSAKLQACQDEADTCTAAAAGDATQLAACTAAQTACTDKLKGDEQHARGDLRNAAAGCFRDGEDDDAGPQGACGRRHHACLEQRTPRDSQCLETLFTCLMTKAGPGAQQDAGLNACVDAAHTCVMSNMSARGRGGPSAGKPGAGNGGPGHGSQAGSGFSSGPGGPGGLAGAPSHAAGFGGPGVGPNAGPGSHAGAGAPGAIPTGPGPRAGAPAHAAGGAGGSRR
jgi:hypothetical protein